MPGAARGDHQRPGGGGQQLAGRQAGARRHAVEQVPEHRAEDHGGQVLRDDDGRDVGLVAGQVEHLQLQRDDARPGAQVRDGKREPEREETPAGRADHRPARVRECAHHRVHRTPRRNGSSGRSAGSSATATGPVTAPTYWLAMSVILDGEQLTLAEVVRVARGDERVEVASAALDRVRAARAVVERAVGGRRRRLRRHDRRRRAQAGARRERRDGRLQPPSAARPPHGDRARRTARGRARRHGAACERLREGHLGRAARAPGARRRRTQRRRDAARAHARLRGPERSRPARRPRLRDLRRHAPGRQGGHLADQQQLVRHRTRRARAGRRPPPARRLHRRSGAGLGGVRGQYLAAAPGGGRGAAVSRHRSAQRADA